VTLATSPRPAWACQPCVRTTLLQHGIPNAPIRRSRRAEHRPTWPAAAPPSLRTACSTSPVTSNTRIKSPLWTGRADGGWPARMLLDFGHSAAHIRRCPTDCKRTAAGWVSVLHGRVDRICRWR
jgi:hypothetical protein